MLEYQTFLNSLNIAPVDALTALTGGLIVITLLIFTLLLGSRKLSHSKFFNFLFVVFSVLALWATVVFPVNIPLSAVVFLALYFPYIFVTWFVFLKKTLRAERKTKAK